MRCCHSLCDLRVIIQKLLSAQHASHDKRNTFEYTSFKRKVKAGAFAVFFFRFCRNLTPHSLSLFLFPSTFLENFVPSHYETECLPCVISSAQVMLVSRNILKLKIHYLPDWLCSKFSMPLNVLKNQCAIECVQKPVCYWMCSITSVLLNVLKNQCAIECAQKPVCYWMC